MLHIITTQSLFDILKIDFFSSTLCNTCCFEVMFYTADTILISPAYLRTRSYVHDANISIYVTRELHSRPSIAVTSVESSTMAAANVRIQCILSGSLCDHSPLAWWWHSKCRENSRDLFDRFEWRHTVKKVNMDSLEYREIWKKICIPSSL